MATPLEGLDEQQTIALDAALARLIGAGGRYRLYRDYYGGDHRLAFATSKYRQAFGDLFAAFADNLCPAVVDAVADKLQVRGWDVKEGQASQADDAQAMWDRNLMDRRSGEVHTESLKAGDAYVIVWQDAQGKAAMWPQRADQVTVVYDDEQPGVVTLAVKAWRTAVRPDGTGGPYRVNVYLPDRLLKYSTKAGQTSGDSLDLKAVNLEPWNVQGEAWPLSHGMGEVPVVPFPNDAAVGAFGRSELRDVIPLQDALNKSVADMMVAMEYVALPQRWATGIEVPTDPETGKPVEGWRPSVDRLWSTPATDANFGEFAAANLAQFLTVQDGFRAEVARVSATPFHYLMLVTGQFPSGEAMKTAEQRFTAKVRDRQAAHGPSWTKVMALGAKCEGATLTVEPDWPDPAPASELDHMNSLKVKGDLGVPQPVLWKEMGYTDQEVADMDAQAAARRPTLADSMAAALNAGM